MKYKLVFWEVLITRLKRVINLDADIVGK